MILDQINYWTILAGRGRSRLSGMVYCHPKLIGALWMRAMEKSGIARRENGNIAIAITIPLSALNSFIFAVVLQWIGAPGPGESGLATGLRAGIIVWLGFSFTSLTINSLFSSATFKLMVINSLHFLILYSAMGAVFGWMQWG